MVRPGRRALDKLPEGLLLIGGTGAECSGHIRRTVYNGTGTQYGVPVEAYGMEVDPAVLGVQPPPAPGDPDAEYTFYVDAQSRLRRLEVNANHWDALWTVTLSGFDEPVDVVTPANARPLPRGGLRR